jgi:hypothetical protein
VKLIFARRDPWAVRHPFALLWLLLIAFGVLGRIDYDTATRSAREAERLAELQRDCATPQPQRSDEAALACAQFLRARALKRARM